MENQTAHETVAKRARKLKTHLDIASRRLVVGVFQGAYFASRVPDKLLRENLNRRRSHGMRKPLEQENTHFEAKAWKAETFLELHIQHILPQLLAKLC